MVPGETVSDSDVRAEMVVEYIMLREQLTKLNPPKIEEKDEEDGWA